MNSKSEEEEEEKEWDGDEGRVWDLESDSTLLLLPISFTLTSPYQINLIPVKYRVGNFTLKKKKNIMIFPNTHE